MKEKELTDKIREVFDHFEDPSADQGWQELRKKYPDNNRIVPIWWWASVAAILTMVGLWTFWPVGTELQYLSKKEHKETNQSAVSDSITGTDANSAAPLNDPKKGVSVAKQETTSDPKTTENKEYSMPQRQPDRPALTKQDEFASHSVTTPKRQPVQSDPELNSVNTLATALDAAANRENQDPTAATPGQQRIDHRVNSMSVKGSLIGLNASPLLSLPAIRQNTLSRDSLIGAQGSALASAVTVPEKDNEKVNDKSNDLKETTLSVYAGSFFNYAEGSETKMNFGAGFGSDFQIDKRLKFSTGIGVAKNNLIYNNGLPLNNSKDVAQSAQPIGPPTSANNLTTITRYEANLVNIDIPINLKYFIIPKAETMYMSAGLSSGIFLSEAYSLNYKNYSSASGAYLSQSNGDKVKRQFQGFDFARTLNFSMGFNTRLGKAQSLSIEPFVKYPIGGVGSENLRFGSSGLNLKLNFSTSKKND